MAQKTLIKPTDETMSNGEEPGAGPHNPQRTGKITLAVPLEWVLPALAGIAAVTEVIELPGHDLDTAYFDSRDLRLLRNGITLGHRHDAQGESGAEHGWTLTLPADADGAALVPRELHWPGSRGETPPEAWRLVRAAVRGDPLHPVARLVTRRRRFRLVLAGGAGGGEIGDEVVAVAEGKHRGERFRQVEVDVPGTGPPGFVEAVVTRLERAGALRCAPVPELSRALDAPADRSPVIPVRTLDRHASIGDVIAVSLGTAVDTLTRHDAGLRLGGDPEHVHRARVATRRLRSELRAFRPALQQDWLNVVEEDLRWAGAALGEVRDADVLRAALEEQIGDLDVPDATEAAAFVARLGQEREAANRRLMAVLDSDRYLTLLSVLANAAIDPPLCAGPGGVAGDEAARNVLPGMVAEAYESLLGYAEALPDEAPEEALHKMRKRAKRLRYASEAAGPVIGKPATTLAGRAEKLQRVLGEFHDAAVSAAWLRDQGLAGTPAQAVAAGQLLSSARRVKGRRRQQWPRCLRKLHNKRLRHWLRGARARATDGCGEPMVQPSPAGGGWISPAEDPSVRTGF